MRVLVKAEIPVEAGNAAIKGGSMQQVLGSVMEALKPEATYFTLTGGNRTALFFVDLKDASDMPRLLEPLFLAFNAKIEVTPVMTPEDLQKGGEGMMQAVQNFG